MTRLADDPATRRTVPAARRRLLPTLTGVACLALASAAIPGCATELDRPVIGDPSPEAEPVPPELRVPTQAGDSTGIDARTIDRTAQPTRGPVDAAGEVSPVDGSADPSVDGPQPGPRGQADDAPFLPPVLATDLGPAAARADSEAGQAEGYRTVGGVLSEVNGVPIFTDDVLRAVENELRGLALRHPRERFLAAAAEVVARERDVQEGDQVRKLVFERNLTPREVRTAAVATAGWRVRQITAAGGSQAAARRIAIDRDGVSLERQADEQYSRLLGQIFYSRKILPRAAPAADEMRDYYQRNRDQFRQVGRIDMRVIEFDARSDLEAARTRARDVRRRALDGETFEELARTYNDNPALRQAGGSPGPLEPGAFRWRVVDDAAWATPVGGLTDVIEADAGRCLFLVHVADKQEPRQLPFVEVQQRIFETIQNRRSQELIAGFIREAEGYAALTPPEEKTRNLQVAMEVVAQRYDLWRRQP